MFRGVATVIAAIWGLSWLISSVSYVRAVAGDAAFWQAMESEYREYCCQNPSKKPRRDAANAFAFLWVGSFFALDFTMDFVDMIPECLLSIFFLVGFCFLRPYLSEKIFRVSAFLCSLHSILSLVLQVLLTLRLWNVDITKIDRSEAVYSAWAQALGLTICRAILFVLPMVSLTLVMMYLIRSGLGHFCKGERTITNQRTVLSLKRGVYLTLAGGAISAISHVAYLALRPKFDFVWIPDVLFSLLFILELYRVMSMLKENLVYERLVEPEAEQGTIA